MVASELVGGVKWTSFVPLILVYFILVECVDGVCVCRHT